MANMSAGVISDEDRDDQDLPLSLATSAGDAVRENALSSRSNAKSSLRCCDFAMAATRRTRIDRQIQVHTTPHTFLTENVCR